MHLKQIIKISKAWWQKTGLTPSKSHAKSALQCAIERELSRLKQENTPLGKDLSFQENRQAAQLK